MLRGALGGAAVSIGLPPLEAMLNANATAHADGSGLPRRFGVFFWANGKTWTHDNKPDLWTPPSSGADWQPSELLAPLAENKGYVNVVTGLTPKTTWTASPAGQEDGHMRGAACALTSDRCMPEGFSHPDHVFAFSRATIDQYIATHPQFYGGSPTRFRSLELSVSDIRFHDYGHWNCISHSGPNMLNLPIRSIAPLYSKLFGVPPDTKVLGARSSVIDAVSDDAKSLMRRLGNRDRQRVEAHLSHLNEINRRLNSGAALCQSPAQPGDYGNPTPSDQLHAKLGAMTDLLVVALQCDLTRVFTMMFSSPATNQVFREVRCHHVDAPALPRRRVEVIRQTTKFQMQAFNLFLTKLRNAAARTSKSGSSTTPSSSARANAGKAITTAWASSQCCSRAKPRAAWPQACTCASRAATAEDPRHDSPCPRHRHAELRLQQRRNVRRFPVAFRG
ncbi:MAG: DUF1552 domain-containing protein [Polyangiales bacterium]